MALACVFSVSKAQLYNYLDDPSGAYSSVAGNATGTNLTRYNGLAADASCGIGFSSFRHTTATTYTNGRPGVEFTVTPDVGYQLNVTSISVDIRHSPKGPTLWRLAYSLDGGATWTNSGADVSIASSTCFTSTNLAFDVTDFSTSSTIKLRIIGHSAHSALNGVSTLKNIILDGTVSLADGDGDGYASDLDCNDADPAVNPGATEVCNGVDDNCDGNIDEGVQTTFYADADGDGFGDVASTTLACEVPTGYVTDATDCNDANALVYPGATEVCNGVDDNCDGNIDEGVQTTFYADADGDGFGDAASTTLACEVPAGYVTDATDCNDANGLVYPGAIEVCNGVDDNCDGNIDEGIDLSIAISPDGIIELCKPNAVTLSGTAGYDSYQWYKNGAALPGETGMEYTTNKPGYYQVQGFIDDCSSDLSAVQAVAVFESPFANIFYPDGLDLCVASPLLLKASYDPTYTYVWFQDGVEIGGATTANYGATSIGDYYCLVTSADGCSRTTATVTVFTTCRAGEIANAASISLYPNPAKESVTISFNNMDDDAIADITISDVTGKMIYAASATGTLTTIQLDSKVASGLYFVTVKIDGAIINQQFVVIK